MIQLIYAIIYSFSANLDNVIIGLSYGLKNAKIPSKINLLIGISTCIITFLSMLIGKLLNLIIPETFANIIGSFTLICLGLNSLINELKHKKAVKFEDETPNIIDRKDIIKIIVALSVNNIATGIAASISGINVLFATMFTFIFSLIFIFIGNLIGIKSKSNNFISKYSNVISAILIIVIGILEL